MDFASIGIVVRSDGVQQGADRLDDLAGAASRAETAAEKVAPAVRQVGAAAQATASQTAAATSALGRQAGTINAAGLSTKQYAQALRLLPAQITDVVTGLASGQSPFIVAIQQGGQLRDSFGGFGNTLRAVTSFLGPVRLAVGGLAGGAAVLVKAFLDGQRESQGFSSALILNGNAAGTTAGELRGLATALDGVIGTEAAAAGVLTQLAGTGRIAGDQLGQVAEAALRLQRETGAPIEETVKLFAQLGERPAEAAAKLNAQYNFLTVAVYDQIRALAEAGRVSEAAALAQETFAAALIDRTGAIEGNLGSLQRAARATGGFFKEMWDSILAVGREETPEERLAELEQRLARLPAATQGARGGGSQRSRVEAEANALREQIAAQREQAKAQADAAAETRRQIAEREKAEKDAASSRQRAAADAQRLRKAQLAVDIADIQRGLDAETQAYGRQEQILEAQRDARLISEQAYYAERRRLIADSTAAQVAALQAENDRLAAEKLGGVEALERQAQVQDNEARIAQLRLEAIALVQQLGIEEAAANLKRQKTAEDATRATEEYLDTLDRQYERELQAQGLGRRQREFNDGRNRLDDRFLDMRQGVERNRGIAGEEETNRQLAELDRLQSQAITRYEDYFQRLIEVQGDWRTGASAALQDYFDEASNVAGQVQDALGGAFRGLEDALVDFAQTGKLNFKDLADSIIADLIRIQARAALSQIFGAIAVAVTGLGGGGGAGGLSSNQLAALNLPARAMGGPVAAGQPYIVGEKGPELMVPSRSGLIVPNHMLGGGGQNVSLTINAAPNTDVATFWAMGERLKEEVRGLVASDAFRNRGLWQRTGA